MGSETREVLVDGLGHPEGPDVLADGRVVFVETYTGRVLVWEDGAGVETFADCGGGPNACLAGDDGWVYVTQNGGHVGGWTADVRVEPSIQRVAPDGEVQVVATSVGGRHLGAPNDLCFGPDGRLYFTDSGRFEPDVRPDEGFICVLEPDGHGVDLVATGTTYPNGITVTDDGALIWVESFDRLVRRRDPNGHVKALARLPEGHTPDGLKVGPDGELWITATAAGGIDVLSSEGELLRFVETGGVPLNCVFGDDGSLYATDFGTFETSGSEAPMVGSLVRLDVEVAGRQLDRGSIEPVPSPRSD